MKTKENTIKSMDTTFRIIEAMKDVGAIGVTELANKLNLTKSSAYKHLNTLEQMGYVIKEDGEYSLSLQFLDIGERVRNRMEIYEIGKPEVDELAEKTGELTNIAVEEHGKCAYVYRARSEQAVRVDTYAGKHVYLHTTALGKAMLAHMPRERVNEIIDRHGLPKMTENTTTSREELFQELDEIQDRGYAFDSEERSQGLRCVAAPVRSNDGELIGAVSVSGPTSRLKGERFEDEIPEEVLSTANVIEINITYS